MLGSVASANNNRRSVSSRTLAQAVNRFRVGDSSMDDAAVGNLTLTIVLPLCVYCATRDSLHMALTGRTAQRGGWQHQAARLALAHTAVATTAIIAADQARHRAAPDPVSCHSKTGDAESLQRLGAGI